MVIPRGHRFAIEFGSAFPQGLVLIGDVAPGNEYQTREDKAAARPLRQKLDQVAGKRQWKATVGVTALAGWVVRLPGRSAAVPATMYAPRRALTVA